MRGVWDQDFCLLRFFSSVTSEYYATAGQACSHMAANHSCPACPSCPLLRRPVQSVCFSSDGLRCAVLSSGNAVRLYVLPPSMSLPAEPAAGGGGGRSASAGPLHRGAAHAHAPQEYPQAKAQFIPAGLEAGMGNGPLTLRRLSFSPDGRTLAADVTYADAPEAATVGEGGGGGKPTKAATGVHGGGEEGVPGGGVGGAEAVEKAAGLAWRSRSVWAWELEGGRVVEVLEGCALLPCACGQLLLSRAAPHSLAFEAGCWSKGGAEEAGEGGWARGTSATTTTASFSSGEQKRVVGPVVAAAPTLFMAGVKYVRGVARVGNRVAVLDGYGCVHFYRSIF